MFKDYGTVTDYTKKIVVETKEGFVEIEQTEEEKKIFE